MAATVNRPLGTTGLNQWAGVVTEEYLPELRGQRGIKVFRQMSEGDATIGAILFATEMLVRGIQWIVREADDSDQASEVKEFAESALHDMEVTFEDALAEIVPTTIVYGFSVFEVIYKRRFGPTNDPRTISEHDDGKLGWRRWAIRPPDTLDRWEFDDEGTATAMVQLAPPDYKARTVPLDRCLHFRAKQRKNSPEGVSLIRNAYESWYFRRRIQQLEAIGIERDLVGLPVMYVQSDILAPDATGTNAAAAASYQEITTNIKRDEQEGVVLPSVFDENGNRLVELTLLSSGGERVFDTDKIVRRYDARIAGSLLADWVQIGHDDTGSFALSREKTTMYRSALGGLLESFAAEVTKGIRTLVRLNGMDAALAPTLVPGAIEKPNLITVATFLSQMVAIGAVTVDPELESYLRDLADLPGRVIDEGNEDAQQQQQQGVKPDVDPEDDAQDPNDAGDVDVDDEGEPIDDEGDRKEKD